MLVVEGTIYIEEDGQYEQKIAGILQLRSNFSLTSSINYCKTEKWHKMILPGQVLEEI